jgi:hypothetical protein
MSWRKEQRPEKEVSILQIKAVRPEYEGEGSNENYSFIFISKQRKMLNFSCEAFLRDNNYSFNYIQGCTRVRLRAPRSQNRFYMSTW